MNILITKNEIQTRISEMASEIDAYYLSQEWYRHSQEPVIVIGVLTGAVFFMADLVRKLSIRTKIDFMKVESYEGTSSHEPMILSEPRILLHDAHILLVDDILDKGKTLNEITKHLFRPWPENVRVAVLLRKKVDRAFDIRPKFVGFDVPDEFVVGYGLDYNDSYRQLPYIATLGREI